MMRLSLYKVVFHNPTRTFLVRAETFVAAFDIAKMIEVVLERPERLRIRSLTEAVIETVTADDDGHRCCKLCKGIGCQYCAGSGCVVGQAELPCSTHTPREGAKP
jgi:hypothetical protein